MSVSDSDGEKHRRANVLPLARGKCPLCCKPVKPEFRPFCSRRCADHDLGNWMGERYYVPGSDVVDPETAGGIKHGDED